MNLKLTIGLDFGTDSVRAVLVDTNNGNILNSAKCDYPRWKAGLYCNAGLSIFRQHPLDYLESLEYVIKEVIKNHPKDAVVGIGVDTTGSTPCVVDKNNQPLALQEKFKGNPNAMFVLWKDHSSIKEAEEINKLCKNYKIDYTKYSGGVYSPEWFWAKYLHIIREDKIIADENYGFIELCDWITSQLSGNLSRSRCAAGHKALWHKEWNGLPSKEFLAALDPILAEKRDFLYEETNTSDVPAGTLSSYWAEKFNLSCNVVIATGLLDCHSGAVGAGIKESTLVKVVGTSTCDIVVASNVERCVKGICGQVDGSVVPNFTGLEAGQSAFGDVYNWFRNFISYGGEVSLTKLEEDALKCPCGQITTIDWLNGRRSPDDNPLLKGAILGLNLGTTAPMVYRGLIEGTCFGSRKIAERLKSEGVNVNRVLAVGGISKKSPLVMQTLADVLNLEIEIVQSDETCALGAAIFGAVAAKIYPDTLSAMEKMASPASFTYKPIKENVEKLDVLYKRYCAYADSLEEVMNKEYNF